MTLTFYRYGSTDTVDELELDETKSSIIDKLNEPTRLSAILTSTTAPQIALGNYTTYEGTRYYITKEPTVRKEHSQLYTVEVDLERSLGLARITILANPVDHRTTFDYTATATEHLQLIIDCLNAKFGEVGLRWQRGAVHCKDTIKHIKYDGATVLGALQQIRETYETDIFADGETLSLGQEDDKTTALPLAYGKGKGLLSGLERHKHTDDTVPTRLYVTGTKRNMTTGRLTLEKDVVLAVDLQSGEIRRHSGALSTTPDGRTLYRTDHTGQYVAEWSPTDQFTQSWRRFPTEATYTNEEIYPSHVSTIQTVTKVKDHFEVNSDFDYTSLRIEGEQMQVVFQSGNLAGRDFDAKYMSSTDRLAIAPKEEDDTTLPNDTLCPKVGDQYIVTGIKLPDQYIKEAQRKLTDEALRHLVKLQQQRYSYKADIDPVYLHNHHNTIAPQLAVGRYVRLTDQQIAVGDPYIRIIAKRTYLDRPYTPEIELSNEIEPPSELTRIGDSLLDRLREDLFGINRSLPARIVGTVRGSQELQELLRGHDGKDGHTPVINWDGTKLIIDDKPPVDIRGHDGRDGTDGKDAGRYLGRATYLHTDLNGNYVPDGSSDWQTANDGDYVYLTSDSGSWLKDNYYIVRERNSKTVWERYDIKGRTPVLTLDGKYRLLADGALVSRESLRGPKGDKPVMTLDSQYHLLADGERISDVSLKGDKGDKGDQGDKGDKGAKGDKGDKPILTLNDKFQLLADGEIVKQESLKGDKGEQGDKGDTGDKGDRGPKGDKGDKPSPDEVLNTDLFGKRLSSEVTKQVSSEVTKQVKPVSDNLSTVSDILTTATNSITNLQDVALTTEMKTDLTYLTNSLQVLRSGDNSLAGLKLQRHIALSGDGVNVSAYIASKPMEAVLKAGITDFGKPTEREEVAINHNGTGHIGNLYFTGNQIDFRTGLDDAPYLSIGAEESEFIDNFLTTARLNDTPVSASSVALTTSTSRYVRTVDVANDGTRLTVSIGDLSVETYRGATTRLTLDGEVLDEWQGVVDIIDGGGGGVNIKPQTIRKPYTASNLSYERVVKAGRHAIRLEITSPNSGAKATIRGLQVRRLYDTGRQQSTLTKSGLRLFGSPDRYLDVDYRQTYVDKSGFSYTRADNDYTVRIQGGAKVDKLTVEELDMPGVPLCGASFNENGGQIKAFGKRAYRRGTNRAQAVYDNGMAAFKVYHSIGNTNYIPIVQVSGWNSGDINWSLTPRVYNITSEYFVVRILSNNDNPHNKAISYVAYKTE